MANRYRKVDARIQNDQKFRTLSERGKLVFFLTMTHPNMTMLGAMRASVPGLAAEWGMPLEGFTEAFQEVLAKGMVKVDMEACFIWLPNFLKYNRPESPNVVKAWIEVFDLLPECDMKHQLFQQLTRFIEGLTEGYRQAFREVFPKTLPNQEQEQEQELSKSGEVRRRATDIISESEIFDGDIWFPQACAAYVKGKASGSQSEMAEFLKCCEEECRLRNLSLMTHAAKWIIDQTGKHATAFTKFREPDKIPYFYNFLTGRKYRLAPPQGSNNQESHNGRQASTPTNQRFDRIVGATARALGITPGGATGGQPGTERTGVVLLDADARALPPAGRGDGHPGVHGDRD